MVVSQGKHPASSGEWIVVIQYLAVPWDSWLSTIQPHFFNMFIIQPDFLVILTYYNPIEVRYSAGFVRFFQDYTESIDAVGRALKVLKAEKKFLGTNKTWPFYTWKMVFGTHFRCAYRRHVIFHDEQQHVCVYIYIWIYIWLYIWIYLWLYIYIYIYTYIYTHGIYTYSQFSRAAVIQPFKLVVS